MNFITEDTGSLPGRKQIPARTEKEKGDQGRFKEMTGLGVLCGKKPVSPMSPW